MNVPQNILSFTITAAIVIAVILLAESIFQFYLSRLKKFFWGLLLPLAHLGYGFASCYIAISKHAYNTTSNTILMNLLIGLLAIGLLYEYFLVRRVRRLKKKLDAENEPAETEDAAPETAAAEEK